MCARACVRCRLSVCLCMWSVSSQSVSGGQVTSAETRKRPLRRRIPQEYVTPSGTVQKPLRKPYATPQGTALASESPRGTSCSCMNATCNNSFVNSLNVKQQVAHLPEGIGSPNSLSLSVSVSRRKWQLMGDVSAAEVGAGSNQRILTARA